MGAKNTSENVPIYVTVLLLHLKICANICKSIRNNIDETIGTWNDIIKTIESR